MLMPRHRLLQHAALVGHARLARDLVVEVERELGAASEEVVQERPHVAGVHLARVQRHRARQVELADDGDAALDDGLPGLRELAVPARLGGEVDDHGAGPHPARRVGGDEDRRLPPGDERGRDHRVRLGDVVGDQLLLALMLVVGERDRVAALAFRALDVELEERGAEALHLLLHCRPHVEGRDDGAEPPRGCDRLQAGDARSENEDARGRDRPRRGGQHRHELRQVVGRDQRALVARDRALG